MKFNIYLTIRGPARIIEAPNNSNPVECINLANLLMQLATQLPDNPHLHLETIGVRVEPIIDSLELEEQGG